MRISDWSSDVCSSDLGTRNGDTAISGLRFRFAPPPYGYGGDGLNPLANQSRSEEHTSELQSLMRISYAVFCLKKTTIYKLIIPIVTHIHNNLIHFVNQLHYPHNTHTQLTPHNT